MSFTKTFSIESFVRAVGDMRVWNYGNYAEPKGSWTGGDACRNNYGAHTMAFEMHNMRFYFSYETLVGFYHHTVGLNLRKNEWGPTTGGHLREIEDDCRTFIAHSRLLANLSVNEFYATMYNVMKRMKLTMAPVWLPKGVLALPDTDEIVDATQFDDLGPIDFTNKLDNLNTPGRRGLREEAKRKEKEKIRKRKEAAKKAAATRKRKKLEAEKAADDARRAEAIMVDVVLDAEEMRGEMLA